MGGHGREARSECTVHRGEQQEQLAHPSSVGRQDTQGWDEQLHPKQGQRQSCWHTPAACRSLDRWNCFTTAHTLRSYSRYSSSASGLKTYSCNGGKGSTNLLN